MITSNALVDNGNFVHTRWLTRDITDRVKAEEILRTSERRRRLALESAGLGTFNIDPATNALTTDERFQAIFGAPGDQITYEQAFAIVHPDDRVDQRDAVEAAIRPDDPVPYATEYRVVHPGGAVRWVFAKANANFVQEGSVRKLRSFDGTVADITDRKHAEQALRESEAFSRTIIESSPDCIKVLDLDGNLLSMQSGQALLGIEDIRPFLNRSWVEFWEGADRRAAREAVATAGAGGRGNFVGLFRTLHGQPKWWDVVISPIRDPNGKPSSLLAVSRDVTLRRRAELNLAFLASVSQDLARFTDVDEMIRTVGAKIGAYLDLSLCAFVEINEAADQVVNAHDWHREDVPGLVGVYRLSDFVGDEFIRTARAGEIIVVRDTAGDRRVDRAGAEQFAALKINSFISVPLIREGQWHFALCLYRSEAYDWREDEVELTRELTARIWTRLERLRTEEAMRQSEERYRHLFNSMDEGYCVIEMQFDEHDKPVDFRYLEVNPSFERESGFVDAKGKLVSELAPPLEALWLETYGKVALTGEPIRYSNEVKALNGAWFDLYAFRVGGEKSRQVAVLFRNITHRREAERALQDSEERYRTLFESMDQAFCIIEMIRDEHGKAVDYRFLVVNPTFGKQTGMSNALGKRMRELVPDLEEHWFEIYGNVALTGEAVRFVNEAKAMGDRWFDVYACRVGGPDSYNVAILFDDITERRRSDEALRKSEERYRNLFDSIDEGFCVAELMFDEHQAPVDFRFLEVNPSFEKQTGMHDALGKRVREFAPDLEASWFQKYGDVASTGVPIRFAEESKNLRRWFDVYAFRIGGRGSRRVAMIFNNITESKKAEQALRDSAEVLADLDRRKDEFLAMLSHELRNPLAPITNAVQLLRLQKDEDPIQEHARSIIERQVGQLNHLVDDLLEVSRITTGRVQLRQERIVVSGVVERAVETARPLIEQRRHEVTVSLPLRPVWLDADASRLEQVVVNLLTNAAKYTGEGGHIWLTVEQEGDVAVLRVRDTGSGIAPELLPHIFDLFTQAERSLDRSQGGLGIGLCLVERLVALHGGTVEVSSVVDRGSEFVVRLPCILAPPLLPPPAKKAELPGAVGGGCRVLVVDDNKDAAEMLGLLLEASGHDVRIAHDGRTALTAIVDYRPAAVLLDIGLPGLDGFEVAKLIRQQPALEKIVLIALTGYGREADRQRSRDAGFDHHLLKPAAFGKVQEILASVSERGDAARLKPTV